MAKVEMKVDGLKDGSKTSVPINLPSNSHKSKEEKNEQPEKKVEKVVTGKVVERKKPLSKKFAAMFLSDNADNVFEYLVSDVLIPAAKDTISDLVSGGIEMLLFGTVKGSRTSRGGARKTFTSYGNCFKGESRERQSDNRSKSRSRHNFDDYVMETRGDAEEVLDRLLDLINYYGSASVADFYDAIGVTGEFTDNRYGWTNLRAAKPIRVRGGGWILDLPKTELVD